MSILATIPREYFDLIEAAYKAPLDRPIRIGPMPFGKAMLARRQFYNHRKVIANIVTQDTDDPKYDVAVKATNIGQSLSCSVMKDDSLTSAVSKPSTVPRHYLVLTRSALAVAWAGHKAQLAADALEEEEKANALANKV